MTKFSGDLDVLRIENHFGSRLQIGCIVPLVLVSGLIWGGILSYGLGVLGIALVAFVASFVLWFVWIRYVGKNHAMRLLKRRPWLAGPLHGVASSGRLTVWHNDLCIQTAMQGYMVDTKRGMISYPDTESTFPWAMIPSSCFFQDQWYDLLSTLSHHRRAERLIVQAATEGSWDCILSPQRSLALKNRTKPLSLKPNGGILVIFLVLGIWLNFVSRSLNYETSFTLVGVLALFLGAYVLIEILRVIYFRFQVVRQFAEGNNEAYRNVPAGQEPQLQWFSKEQVLFSDTNHWVLCPVKYVQRVKVRVYWIEFRIGDQTVLFHREGFADEASWRGACQDALAIGRELGTQ